MITLIPKSNHHEPVSDWVTLNFNQIMGGCQIHFGVLSKANFKVDSNILCSGVFIIKNSKIGKKFIDDCINKWDKLNCITNDKKLWVFFDEFNTSDELSYFK